MNVSPYLFSIATSSLAHGEPWNFRMLTDPTSSAAFRNIGLKAVRINAIATLQRIWGPAVNTGPDWSTIQPLVQGFNTALPGCKLIMTLMNHDTFNHNDAALRGRIANAYVQTAKYLRDHGVKVDYWEVTNEPDFDHSPDLTATMERETRNAFRAANDPTPVGGPCTSWARTDYMNASANAGSQFTSWHAYAKGPEVQMSTDQLFDLALNYIGSGGSGPKPWFLTEHYIDTWYNPSIPPDPRQQTIEGAIFTALVGVACAGRDLAGTFIWRLENDDGSYGVFYIGTWNLNPCGYLIQAANKYLVAGPIIPFNTNNAKVVALQSGGQTGKSLMLVNFATQGSNVTIGVPPEYTIRWIQNPTDKHGKLVGGSQVTTVSLPPMGVAILTTNAAPGIPDDPDGKKVGVGVPLHANGHTWLIKGDAKVWVDEQVDNTTANVVQLWFTGGLVVQTNAAGGMWSKTQPSDPWATFTPPPPNPNPEPEPPTDAEMKAKQWDALVAAMTPLVKQITP